MQRWLCCLSFYLLRLDEQRVVEPGNGRRSFYWTVYKWRQLEMVADMSYSGQNDSLFDILGQLVEETNQSNLYVAQGDHLNADMVKVGSLILFLGWLGWFILLVRDWGSADDFHRLLGRGLQSRLIRSLCQTEMSPNISQVDTPPLVLSAAFLHDVQKGESLSCNWILWESTSVCNLQKEFLCGTLKCPGKVSVFEVPQPVQAG